MHLVKGADVYSSSGEKLGSLSRVILDPNSRKVTHLVVEKGLLFTSNKLIPINRVNPENEEMIILRPPEEKTEDFDDFEEEHFVSLEPGEYQQGDIASSYWYPPTDSALWRSSMQAAYPPMPAYTVRTTQNIPDGTVAMEEGAKVLSADGKQVGNIEQLVVDPKNKRVTHFVISAGTFFKERKLIPVQWISTISEQQVDLSVNAGTLERLPAFQKVP